MLPSPLSQRGFNSKHWPVQTGRLKVSQGLPGVRGTTLAPLLKPRRNTALMRGCQPWAELAVQGRVAYEREQASRAVFRPYSPKASRPRCSGAQRFSCGYGRWAGLSLARTQLVALR